MELWVEAGAGPHGKDVIALLYTIAPGKTYAIERGAPIQGLTGPASLQLMAKATRALHLALVLVDTDETEHECARTLVPGEWQTLTFDSFRPAIGDWSQVTVVRLEDRTAVLGSQGPVSLKLVGLP